MSDLEKIRAGEYVEYGNVVPRSDVVKAAEAMAKALRKIGPREWITYPQVLRSATPGEFGWYGMAKKASEE